MSEKDCTMFDDFFAEQDEPEFDLDTAMKEMISAVRNKPITELVQDNQPERPSRELRTKWRDERRQKEKEEKERLSIEKKEKELLQAEVKKAKQLQKAISLAERRLKKQQENQRLLERFNVLSQANQKLQDAIEQENEKFQEFANSEHFELVKPKKQKPHAALSEEIQEVQKKRGGFQPAPMHPDVTNFLAKKISYSNSSARGRADNCETIEWFEIYDILEAQDFKCVYCKQNLGHDFHIDHIVPLSKNGTHEVSNLQCLCPTCNLGKHTMTHDEYVEYCKKMSQAWRE